MSSTRYLIPFCRELTLLNGCFMHFSAQDSDLQASGITFLYKPTLANVILYKPNALGSGLFVDCNPGALTKLRLSTPPPLFQRGCIPYSYLYIAQM